MLRHCHVCLPTAALAAFLISIAPSSVPAEDMMRPEGMGHGNRIMEGIGLGIAIGEVVKGAGQPSGEISNDPKTRKPPPKRPASEIDTSKRKKNQDPPRDPPGNPPDTRKKDASDPPAPKDGGKPAAPPLPQTVDDKTPKQNCCSCVTGMKLVYQQKDRLRGLATHGFQLEVSFNTIKSETHGPLKLEWFERSKRPPHVAKLGGATPGDWYESETIRKSTNEVTKKGHRPKQAGDKKEDLTTVSELIETGKIDDENAGDPKLARGTMTVWPRNYLANRAHICTDKTENQTPIIIQDKPGANVPRRLDFHFVVQSDPICKCPEPTKLELYATQVLRFKKPGDKELSLDDGVSGMWGPNGQLKINDKVEGTAPPAKEPDAPKVD